MMFKLKEEQSFPGKVEFVIYIDGRCTFQHKMWILLAINKGTFSFFGVVFRVHPRKNSFSRALFGTEFLAI